MTEPLRVFIAGEGAMDLGSRNAPPSLQTDDRPGVLATLLRKLRPEGWQIVGATTWSRIRKATSPKRDHADLHNVKALVLDAREVDADLVVFLRDLDRDPDREQAIHDGVAAALADASETIRIAAGTPMPCIEGWMLALKSHRRTEELSSSAAKERLRDLGVETFEDVIDLVEKSDLALTNAVVKGCADDATRLVAWSLKIGAAVPQPD